MKKVVSLPLLLASIAVFVLSSCASTDNAYPMEEAADDQAQIESEPDYSDFYYHDASEFPSNYHSAFISGYSYYCGVGVCPICHQHPCIGHKGRSSSWSHHADGNLVHDGHDHHSNDTHAHNDHDHHGSNSVTQHGKSDPYSSGSDKTGKGKDDHASTTRGTKPVSHFTAAEYKMMSSRASSSSSGGGYSHSSSSSSSGSSGRGSSSSGSSSKSSSKSDDKKST